MKIEVLNQPDPWELVLDEAVNSATVDLGNHVGAEKIRVTLGIERESTTEAAVVPTLDPLDHEAMLDRHLELQARVAVLESKVGVGPTGPDE